jgi:hypothetical protein
LELGVLESSRSTVRKVQAFLSGLDIDITDARIVYTLLDVEPWLSKKSRTEHVVRTTYF